MGKVRDKLLKEENKKTTKELTHEQKRDLLTWAVWSFYVNEEWDAVFDGIEGNIESEWNIPRSEEAFYQLAKDYVDDHGDDIEEIFAKMNELSDERISLLIR